MIFFTHLRAEIFRGVLVHVCQTLWPEIKVLVFKIVGENFFVEKFDFNPVFTSF